MRKRPTRRGISYLALALVGVVIAVVVTAECQRRRGLYWYDVGRDYVYRFAGDFVRKVPVQLDADGFVPPELDRPWDTALLEIDLRSRLAGKWFEPSLTVRYESGFTVSQYYERGAAGVRYVNLGSALAAAAAKSRRIELEGGHLKWQPQQATLLLFQNPQLEGSRILVVAPHPDDAEIAAFGLYAQRDSWIVTLTHGSYRDADYARFLDDDVSRYSLKARVRVWDSLVIPRWGGLAPDRSLQLGYATNTLEAMHASPDSVVPDPVSASTNIGELREWNESDLLADRRPSPTWRSLVEDLEAVIREVRPGIIVAPHPLLDGSSDHVYSTLALFEALDQLGQDEGELFLYTNHHISSHYYPFGPADASVTLPPWFDGRSPFRGVYSYELGELRRTEKLFALEAMHDLRRKPDWEVGGPSARAIRGLRSTLSAILRDPAREHSFFRRAARPNELFFVYPLGDRKAILETFSSADTATERAYR